MAMRASVVGYWIVTGLASLALLGSGLANVMGAPEVMANFARMGYPAYFPMILGGWKVLAALALLTPRWPRLKEWAYAGVTFAMTGAALSHLLMKDPIGQALAPLVILGLALGSAALRPPRLRVAAQAA